MCSRRLKTKGYSIWLVPGDENYKLLFDLIVSLSKKYPSPGFEPHITLIGGIDLPEGKAVVKTYKIASQLKQFSITLDQIGYQNFYFRSLYLQGKVSSQKVFGVKDTSPYFPHLSLLYGNISEFEKLKIISGLAKKIRLPLKIKIKELCLYKTQGKVQDWYSVARFRLS